MIAPSKAEAGSRRTRPSGADEVFSLTRHLAPYIMLDLLFAAGVAASEVLRGSGATIRTKWGSPPREAERRPRPSRACRCTRRRASSPHHRSGALPCALARSVSAPPSGEPFCSLETSRHPEAVFAQNLAILLGQLEK